MYSWTKFGYVLLTVLSGGIFWVLIRLLPVWATYLLTSCPLEQADFVHVEVTDNKHTAFELVLSNSADLCYYDDFKSMLYCMISRSQLAVCVLACS